MILNGDDRDWDRYDLYCANWAHSLVRKATEVHKHYVASVYYCLACQLTRIIFTETKSGDGDASEPLGVKK